MKSKHTTFPFPFSAPFVPHLSSILFPTFYLSFSYSVTECLQRQMAQAALRGLPGSRNPTPGLQYDHSSKHRSPRTHRCKRQHLHRKATRISKNSPRMLSSKRVTRTVLNLPFKLCLYKHQVKVMISPHRCSI